MAELFDPNVYETPEGDVVPNPESGTYRELPRVAQYRINQEALLHEHPETVLRAEDDRTIITPARQFAKEQTQQLARNRVAAAQAEVDAADAARQTELAELAEYGLLTPDGRPVVGAKGLLASRKRDTEQKESS